MNRYLNFCIIVSFLTSVRLSAADFSNPDCDSFALVLSGLKHADLCACRLICFEWRVAVDWYLKNRAKYKKVKPILTSLEECDFGRLACIDTAYTVYHKGDYSKAFRLFSTVASLGRGNAQAAFITGHLFLLGRGVNKSIREGLYQLQLAAEADFLPALFDLGLIFLTGNDAEHNPIIEKDLGKAYSYFQQAHENGHIGATYHFGLMYYEGLDVKKDRDYGLRFIRLSAEKGYETAIETLIIIDAD